MHDNVGLTPTGGLVVRDKSDESANNPSAKCLVFKMMVRRGSVWLSPGL